MNPSELLVSYHIMENFRGRKLSRIATNLEICSFESFSLYHIQHFELIHTRYSSGIPTLVVAGASIDVVISISLFGVFLGLVFSDGEW